jgi:hypothetical protein
MREVRDMSNLLVFLSKRVQHFRADSNISGFDLHLMYQTHLSFNAFQIDILNLLLDHDASPGHFYLDLNIYEAIYRQ